MNVKRVTTPPDAGKSPKWQRHGERGELEEYASLEAERAGLWMKAEVLTIRMHHIRDKIKSRARYRDRHLPAIRSINERIAAE